MKKLAGEREYKKTKHFFLILTFLLIILSVTVVLQVFLANQLVETGEKIKSLENKIEIINKENQNLQEKIVEEASLEKIQKKAEKDLGLAETTSFIYLSIPPPIAFYQ